MADPEVQGLREVSLRLRRLPEAVRRKHANKALRAGMRPVAAAARRNVPVATGLVRKNIRTRTVPLRQLTNGATVQLGVKSNRSGRGSGTDAYYWRFLELGTVNIERREFLQRAFEANKYKAAELIRRHLSRGIQTEARKR